MTKFASRTEIVSADAVDEPAKPETKPTPAKAAPEVSDSVRTLLEKNLKWSQIIYEQNRKLNSKLMWMAVAGWLRVVLIAAPLVLAIVYLPVFYQKLQDKFGYLLDSSAQAKSSTASLKDILKVLPLNELQRQELQTILK